MLRSKVGVGQFLLCLLVFIVGLACAQPDAPQNRRKVTNRVVPSYPELARTMKVKGTVRLEVLVASDGTVKSLNVRGGHPVLVQAAQQAVQKWKWERAGHDSRELVEFKFGPD